MNLPGPDELFFAYGSLKQGGQYHHFLLEQRAVCLGSGRLTIPYPLYLSAYPCLVDEPGKGHLVKGEVYRIPASSPWTRLDWLEGHPEEYRRRLEPVDLEGRRLSAWTYFYLRLERLEPGLEPVEEFRIAGSA
jgi:gamma-glutamylcyclotransferase (GGCT)/AIG2-like uncharacterized protein YtfP